MTDKDFFTKTIEDEIPRFERVFKAIPESNRDYKPDPKSKTAVEIAMTIAGEASTFIVFLKTGVIDMAQVAGKVSNLEEAIKVFSTSMEEAKNYSSSMSIEEWGSKAEMLSSGHKEWETTRGAMALSLLLDIIHHRGQISSYLRAMGGTVPSIYGPSADSK